MCQLLSQHVGIIADCDYVPLNGLGLGLENREAIRGRGVNFCKYFLILANSGELSNQVLEELLYVLPIHLS